VKSSDSNCQVIATACQVIATGAAYSSVHLQAAARDWGAAGVSSRSTFVFVFAATET